MCCENIYVYRYILSTSAFSQLPLQLCTLVLLHLSVCRSEVNDGQKRRRLEAAGQENRSPNPSSSGRIAELETKPDTPMVPSVRSRVQELTQRRGGNPTLEITEGRLICSPKCFINTFPKKLIQQRHESLMAVELNCTCLDLINWLLNVYVYVFRHMRILQLMLAGFMVPLKIVVRHGSQDQHSDWIISTQDEKYCQGVEQSVRSCCDCDV